jgi:hypothetical protein
MSNYYYLVSLLLLSSSWPCSVQGRSSYGSSSGTAQIVGTKGTPSSATIQSNHHHLFDTLRTKEPEGEDTNYSMYCSSSPIAPSSATASGATETTGTGRTTGSPFHLFSVEQHQSFAHDGFLIVRDLFPRPMLDELINAGETFMANTQKMEAYFTSIEMGMIFQAGNGSGHQQEGGSSATSGTNHTTNSNHTITKAFRNVAFDSILPQAAAELMQLSPSQHVRVLR